VPARRPSTVPELVKKIRELRDLTQEALAREIGVSFSTVNGWENGKHTPMPLLLNVLVKLARECGLDPQISPARRETRGTAAAPPGSEDGNTE
jgi:transcriptional regulator with XRE-family HTH domain